MPPPRLLQASDFYQQQYGIMFDAMVELFNEGKPVDLVTLQDRLKEKDVPPEVSSLDFVRDIMTIGADLGQCQILCRRLCGKRQCCAV